MPKLFKQNILHDLATGNPPITPEELIKQHSTETASPIALEHNGEAPNHPVIFTHKESEHHNAMEPTEIIFPMPRNEEELLPSPLDTLELPEHTASSQNINNEETGDGPIFKPHAVNPVIASPSFDNIPFQAAGFNNFPVPENKMIETLMTWKAPSRPHRKKNRSFYTTVAILIILIAMIALLAGERMLVAVLFALMFLVYVLNFIEPGEIDYKISTQGVTIDDHFYHWQEMDSFWFEKKDGYTVLHIFTQLKFPTMVMMVLAQTTEESEVKKIVARFLPFHEIPPKSTVEKWGEGLQKYFQLETPHH